MEDGKLTVAYTIAFEREGLGRRWKVYSTRVALDPEADEVAAEYETIGNPLGYEDLEDAGRVLAEFLDLSHVPF